MEPPADVIERVTELLGQRPAEWRPATGGYTPALRYITRRPSAFVKAAVDDLTAGWLRKEARFYEAVAAPFLASVLGFDDGDGHGLPVLVLEDLSTRHWPPPWRAGDVDAVMTTLEQVASTPAPEFVPPLTASHRLLDLWPRVAEDPQPLLRLGVCDAPWLERALPVLVEASAQADLSGDALCHFDTRSDNLAIGDGTVVIVDWNGPAVGTAQLDPVSWMPSLAAEGGPLPHEVLPDADPRLVALVTGYFAFHAGQPTIPNAPRVREVQLVQLRTSLPWAARVLGLPPPP